MSTEAKQVTHIDTWTQWEGQVVNGIFPLRRFLGGSDHGAVFLSDYKARNLANVAIKFVPADPLHAQAQLAQWGTAAALSHPHLIRLFDWGRYQAGGREFLFVVMEYAEQTLAQVVSRRALNADEVLEMLLPTLDALAFLHRNHVVHSQLKPSNVLAVGDQLKLASDTLRPAGKSGSGIVRNLSYDPPELQHHGVSSAGDIWSLGITLFETLTQRTPTWSDERDVTVSLPAPFGDTVRRCLSPAPADRPTAIELETQYKPAPQAPSVPEPQPPAQELPREVAASRSSPLQQPLLLAIAALLISLIVWISLNFSGASQDRLQLPAAAAPAPAAPSAIVKPAQSNSGPASSPTGPAVKPSPPPATASPSVLLEVSPEVPQAIRDKIRGRVLVTVRVLVDPAGNVIGALMEHAGPSKYFARLSGNAAREWKFVPASNQAPRVWLLTFAFTRDGVTARATAV